MEKNPIFSNIVIFEYCDIYDFGCSFSALQLRICPKCLIKMNNTSIEGVSTNKERFLSQGSLHGNGCLSYTPILLLELKIFHWGVGF